MRDPSEPRPPRRPLRRSRRHRVVAGVCGGLAEWLGWGPLLVRVLFVLVGALPFLSGILVYGVLWRLIPLEDVAAGDDHRAGAPAGASHAKARR
jgi:phage shock protein PspC (stress-responsive transcriptional regulator)